MMKTKREISPFNSSIEIGVRALSILEAAYPETLDLGRIVEYDYLLVHTGDAGGPDSLHAPLPLRTGEILVRRSAIESGLLLMMSRNLIGQIPTDKGIEYFATDSAHPFLSSLCSDYLRNLKDRAYWVIQEFNKYTDTELMALTRRLFDKWTTQFQPIERSRGELT